MAFPRLLGRVLLDVLSLVIVLAPSTGLEFFAHPYRRGFFCDDDSIGYPYLDDTVPVWALMVVVLAVPLLLIASVEAIQYNAGKRRDNFGSRQWTIRNFFILLYKIYGIYLFGQAITVSVTEVSKFTTGRLRPHFLAVCQPNQNFNCTARHAGNVYQIYVADDVCTTYEKVLLRDARLSFPSGHSSMSFFFAVFLMLYLQSRMTWSFSRLLRPSIQTLFLLVAVYIGLSRVSDYKHHWSDVTAGAAVGAIAAVLVGLYISSQISGWKLEPQQLNYQQLDEVEAVVSSTETTGNP